MLNNGGKYMNVANKNNEVDNYKKEAIKIARDFNYPVMVLLDLKTATSIAQISRIMCSARQGYYNIA